MMLHLSARNWRRLTVVPLLLVLLLVLLWLGWRGFTLQAQSGYSCSSAYRIDVTLPTGARWDMCWESRTLEGIVLHDVHYTPPGGPRRLILASAALAQIHVPYDDNGARFHDVSDFGLGGQYLLNLTPEECPAGTLLSDYAKNVLCLQTPPRGYAYKYFGRQTQGHALNLFSVSASGDYNYISAWRFTDDGTIEPSVGAAGKLQRYGSSERYGWRTAPQRIPVSHTHNYYWRLDFDIDGLDHDLVEEIEFLPEDESRKRAINVTPLTEEASRTLSPTTMRSWRIRDKLSVNAEGHPISYHLDPIRNGHQFIGPAFEPFTQHDFYVTAVKPCERFISHNPTVGGCGRDVTEFVDGQSVDGTDLVVWYGVTFHHLPRDEDEDDMPVHWDGFQILPRDWLAASPPLSGEIVQATPPPPAATATSTPVPTPTATPPALPSATPDGAECRELLTNGGFESSEGWRFGSTPVQAAYVNEPVRRGSRALRQGIAAGGANRYTHSSAYQTVAIPADAAQSILRLAELAGPTGDGTDYRELLLLDSSYRLLALLDRVRAGDDSGWTERSYDLSAYRGRTVIIYLNVYNDGRGTTMWRFLDDVSVESCSTATAAGASARSPQVAPAAAAGTGLSVFPPRVELRDDVELAGQVLAIDTVPGNASLTWHALSTTDWLRLSADNGQTPGELTVELAPKSLREGLYTGVVTLTSPQVPEQTVELRIQARVGDGYVHFLPLVMR